MRRRRVAGGNTGQHLADHGIAFFDAGLTTHGRVRQVVAFFRGLVVHNADLVGNAPAPRLSGGGNRAGEERQAAEEGRPGAHFFQQMIDLDADRIQSGGDVADGDAVMPQSRGMRCFLNAVKGLVITRPPEFAAHEHQAAVAARIACCASRRPAVR